LSRALEKVSQRRIPVVTANDGHLAGVGESAILHKSKRGSILMLAPGSGLGCSFVNAEGILLSGDNNSAVLLGHIPAPLNKLGLPPFFCGCGRDWGCFEAFTTISGLPQFLKHFLPEYKDHRLHASSGTEKEMALSLRGLAQEGDELALKIFDFQARALGYAVAAGCMAFDPTHVLIGGGLMDKGSTTQHFRNRYLNGVRKSAAEYLWVDSGKVAINEAVLGELAQAIGAAHLARNLSA
jgi:glucokinase